MQIKLRKKPLFWECTKYTRSYFQKKYLSILGTSTYSLFLQKNHRNNSPAGVFLDNLFPERAYIINLPSKKTASTEGDSFLIFPPKITENTLLLIIL